MSNLKHTDEEVLHSFILGDLSLPSKERYAAANLKEICSLEAFLIRIAVFLRNKLINKQGQVKTIKQKNIFHKLQNIGLYFEIAIFLISLTHDLIRCLRKVQAQQEKDEQGRVLE